MGKTTRSELDKKELEEDIIELKQLRDSEKDAVAYDTYKVITNKINARGA